MKVEVVLSEADIAQEFVEAIEARDLPEKFFFWFPRSAAEWSALTGDKEPIALVSAIKSEVDRLSRIAEQYLSVARRPRQSSPFDRGEVFAYAVEFVDRRAAGHQQPGDCQLVGQGQTGSRGRQERARAARNQNEAQIVSRKLTHAVQNLFRAGDSLWRRFVHTGRSGCVQVDADERAHAVRRHIHPAGQPLGQRRSGSRPRTFVEKSHA